MKIVLAGGSGSLGRRLAADLSPRGHEVVILTRSPQSASPHRQVPWDGATVGRGRLSWKGRRSSTWPGRWSTDGRRRANIELLTRSRVEPIKALAAAAATLTTPPAAWILASTLAIYGDGGEAVLDESSPPANGPAQMAGVARAWEAAAAAELSTGRQVVMRTGIVLDRGTPAMDRLTGLVRWGLGGRIADGRQWVSWIHINDFLAVARRGLGDDGLSGVVHVTSPNPVRNAELMAILRKLLHRPAAPPTPAALVRLGARLLRTDPALALTGRRCVPARLLAEGFHIHLPQAG